MKFENVKKGISSDKVKFWRERCPEREMLDTMSDHSIKVRKSINISVQLLTPFCFRFVLFSTWLRARMDFPISRWPSSDELWYLLETNVRVNSTHWPSNWMDRWVSEWVSTWVSQSVGQSVNQRISELVSVRVSQSSNQSVSQLVS